MKTIALGLSTQKIKGMLSILSEEHTVAHSIAHVKLIGPLKKKTSQVPGARIRAHAILAKNLSVRRFNHSAIGTNVLRKILNDHYKFQTSFSILSH